MREYIIVFVVLLLQGAVFLSLGACSWRRKKPMWFWSGLDVREEEIEDIPAYNKANAIMWSVFGSLFWADAVLGLFKPKLAVMVLIILCGCSPLLVVCYNRIYKKYKKI